MSVHAMPPIREEEIESTMPADVGSPTLEGDASVNAKIAANTAMATSEKEEIKTSGSTSTMVPIHQGVQKEVGSGTIAIGYFFQLPCVKWHPELEMMSKVGLSQGQYERRVLAQGFDVPEEIDEFISIDCPDMPMGVSRTFSIQRSALMRSPVLANFFTSLDYLPGCKMALHFMNDPGVCFEAVQVYLESGPDCYPMLRLKIYITRLTKNADRFLVLIRLHKFAINLGLIHLKNMALEVLHDLEWEMSAEFCPKIAQLVFAHQSPYDNTIKLWILKHIGHFHKKLSRSNAWAALVPTLDAELGQHWATMNASGVRVLSMIAEEATDEAVSDVLASLSTPVKNSAVSDVKGPSSSSSPTNSEASTQTDDTSLTEIPNKSELSALPKPELKKTNDAPLKAKKPRKSKALMSNNHFIVGMHKEWVITCSPTKRLKKSSKSIKFASPPTSKPEIEQTNKDMAQEQPTITVSLYEGDTSAVPEHNEASLIKSTEQHDEGLHKQQEQDDNEWEDEEEEEAIQEAISSFGSQPRDDSKAREVLGLPERPASFDGPPRPHDENAKARRVLGINDDGGGFIAGRKEPTKMTRVKKTMIKFNNILNP